MEFPAASTSLSLHFPPNFVGKPKPRFQLQINNASFWCKTFRTQTPFSDSNLHSTSFSVSRACTCTCTDESDQGPVSLNNPKDWVHFVGIGGCGLSALAMLALKQVRHYVKALISVFFAEGQVEENNGKSSNKKRNIIFFSFS